MILFLQWLLFSTDLWNTYIICKRGKGKVHFTITTIWKPSREFIKFKMADLITIAGRIVSVAVYIHRVIDEVKAFPKYAQKLDFKIQLMKPSLDTLVSMETERQQLADACKREPKLDLFGASLSRMLHCVKEVETFINNIKDMNNLKKITEKNAVKEKFEELEWKLDELQKSIQFGVIIEVRKEIESNQKVDKVQTLIKHVKNSGAFGATSGGSVPSSPAKAKGECSHLHLTSLARASFTRVCVWMFMQCVDMHCQSTKISLALQWRLGINRQSDTPLLRHIFSPTRRESNNYFPFPTEASFFSD